MISRIPVEYYPDIKGEAEILQLFDITVSKKRVETIGGAKVISGSISRGLSARVVRGDKEVWRGGVKTLKNLKRDVNEVVKGSECGIGLDGFQGVKVGDRVMSFVDVVKVQSL